MNTEFVDAVRRIESACGKIISRDTEDLSLHDARCLITSVMMRAVGISKFLMDAQQDDPARLRDRIHEAFGSPGDWGYESALGAALAALYQVVL